MSDVVRSMIRLSWAMSLFGIRQTAELVTALGTARAPRQVSAAFDAVAAAASEQLEGRLRRAHRDGDRWQGRLIDAAFSTLDPAFDASRQALTQTVLRGSLITFRQSAELLSAALPAPSRATWQEVRNKLEAFEHFQFVDQILDFRGLSRRASDLRDRVEAAERCGPFMTLWLTEGLGYAFAEAAWQAGEPRDLLRRSSLDELPAESLIPLHTGMGLSLARRLLPDLDPPSPAAVSAALERYERLCRSNARDGFALASYEALGLIVRHLAGEAVGEIDRALARAGDGEKHRGAFWHGLGRGLYFVVTQTLPGSTGRAVAKARREAPDAAARLNALAGLAWAVALVNFRQPEVLERFLEDQQFRGAEGDAVAHGIASAFLLWADAAGRETFFEAFRHHRPGAGAAELWRRRVSEPCEQALERWHEIKRGAGPGEIFQYRRADRRQG